MAIYTQIDISSDVALVFENFRKYVPFCSSNFEDYLDAIRDGKPIQFGDRELNLDSCDEGVVYRNFVHILYGQSNLDYRVCDAAIKQSLLIISSFRKFIKAVITGVLACDLKKQREREEGKNFLAINPSHGMFHQAEVFLNHFSTDPPKLGCIENNLMSYKKC